MRRRWRRTSSPTMSIVAADNPDRKLLPGMTATTHDHDRAKRRTCCACRAAALRFKPEAATTGDAATALDGRRRRRSRAAHHVRSWPQRRARCRGHGGDLRPGNAVIVGDGGTGRRPPALASRCSVCRPWPILVVELSGVSRAPPVGGRRSRRAGRRRPAHRARRVRRHHGAVGFGQVDPDEHARLPRPADRGHLPARRRGRRRRLDRRRWRAVRNRKIGFVLPDASTCCRARRRSRTWRCRWSTPACRRRGAGAAAASSGDGRPGRAAATTGRTSSPAASSSGSRSRARW